MCLLLLYPVPQMDDAVRRLEPLLAGHCVACHGGERPKAGLDFRVLLADPHLTERRDTLERMRAVLRAGEMPPPREERPPAELVEGALAWLERALGPADVRPGLRRLNRVEYEHAV